MATERKISGYGWKPDLPDYRDRIYNLEEKIQVESALPSKVSLRDSEPSIYDQGQLGSCTANAIGFAVDFQRHIQNESFINPSRLFIYYEERVIENSVNQDAGAEIRDGIKVVASKGVPPENEWPYSDAQPGPFNQKPPQNVYDDATRYEALRYQRIVPGHGSPILTAVTNHHPVVFGFSVPSIFEDPSWDPATQYLPLPGKNDQIIGGHAVAIVGYDFTRTRFDVPVFEIRNSWGADWGDQGHFWMHWGWLNPIKGLSDDLWVISLES